MLNHSKELSTVMLKYIPLACSALLLFISCNDNSADPIIDDPFLVSIKVVDSSGNPVPDLNISIWNKLPFMNQADKHRIINQITASSSINFRVSEESFISISLYDLNNKFINYIAAGNYQQGVYEISLILNEIIGTAVYKCVMNASTDSTGNDILFRDSIYITLWQPDPKYSLVGSTNQQGELSIDNKMLFPHLYDPPQIPRTSEASPEILGYINISDSVTIALSDSTYMSSIEYHHLIIDGENKFTLVWDGNTAEGSVHKQNIEAINGTILDYFYAEMIYNNVVLYWGTLEEQNNRGFEIEKMSGTNWSTIGFIEGSGTTSEPQSYSFTDSYLSPGLYKYRLKQIQLDGSFNYSSSIEVDVGMLLEWHLSQNYPNPFN